MKGAATEQDYFRRLTECLEQVRAEARLQAMVEDKRTPFTCERYRRNRAAQMKSRCADRAA